MRQGTTKVFRTLKIDDRSTTIEILHIEDGTNGRTYGVSIYFDGRVINIHLIFFIKN